MGMMRRQLKVAPVLAGVGRLTFPGYADDIAYEISGPLNGLRPGGPALRGLFRTTPDQAQVIFGAIRANLLLEDGRACRVTMLGHTAGAGVAYFEICR
jgi:hypothetical protein